MGIPLLERTTQQNDKTANSKFCAEHEGLYIICFTLTFNARNIWSYRPVFTE